LVISGVPRKSSENGGGGGAQPWKGWAVGQGKRET